MSENDKVVGFKKGFRQTKKPTKGEVQKENVNLAQQLQAQLNFLAQQTMNAMQKSMQLDKELDQMAKLICHTPTDTLKEGDLAMVGYMGQLVKEDDSLENPTQDMYAPYALIDLGSHQFVPGFEEQLLDSKVGDVKTIEITFPEKYPEQLANKKARFKVQVHAAWTPAKNEIEADYISFKKAEAEKAKAEELIPAEEQDPTKPELKPGESVDSQE